MIKITRQTCQVEGNKQGKSCDLSNATMPAKKEEIRKKKEKADDQVTARLQRVVVLMSASLDVLLSHPNRDLKKVKNGELVSYLRAFKQMPEFAKNPNVKTTGAKKDLVKYLSICLEACQPGGKFRDAFLAYKSPMP